MAMTTVHGNENEGVPLFGRNDLEGRDVDRAIFNRFVTPELRHPVDLEGFGCVAAMIPKGTTLSDLIEDSASNMDNALEILRAATAEVERADRGLGRLLAGATTLFQQAASMQEAIHDVIIGRADLIARKAHLVSGEV